jgi:hypothetical protein
VAFKTFAGGNRMTISRRSCETATLPACNSFRSIPAVTLPLTNRSIFCPPQLKNQLPCFFARTSVSIRNTVVCKICVDSIRRSAPASVMITGVGDGTGVSVGAAAGAARAVAVGTRVMVGEIVASVSGRPAVGARVSPPMLNPRPATKATATRISRTMIPKCRFAAR